MSFATLSFIKPGMGQMAKVTYWAHVGTVDDTTQWRADVMRRGRTTAVQIEELSCSATLSFEQQFSVLSVEILGFKFLVESLAQDLN